MIFRSVRLKSVIIAASVSFIMGLVLSSRLDLTSLSNALESTPAKRGALEAPPKLQNLPDFVSLVKKLSPAVVNISTVQIREAGPAMPNPFGEGDPFSEFWRRFGEPTPRGRSREQSLGSGLILSSDGFILTNNHVIENADEIQVRLSDEREFSAKVVGKDPKTDIALLKIDAKGQLPTAPLGDSSLLQVGEWVLAVGNPFGLDHTVTSGIVSAIGRRIGAGPYDNFIQTDASINPGNSGGPLINTMGEVVGINTAIFSRSGGNIGIGFAIPINLVKDLLPQLKQHGKVTRGWLGVTIQKLTPDLADSLGMGTPQGALVADISDPGPAQQAGLQTGDVIVEFDGKQVKEPGELALRVAGTPVGKKVPLKALRKGKEIALEVTIGELKEEETLASATEKATFGLTVQGITPEIARSLGMDRPEGVVVTAVEPGSLADEGGMRRGDVILEVDRKLISSLEDFQKATAKLPKGKSTLFLVKREGMNMFFALKNLS